MAKHGYNLIIKADTVQQAIDDGVNEWLSMVGVEPATGASLGYGEVMVSLNTDNDLSEALNEWHNETTDIAGAPFDVGALIAWKE